jgi:hypothetical protein
MRRKLMLPALAACALLAVSAPVAPAKSHKAHAASLASALSTLSGAVKGLKKGLKNVENVNSGQTGAINGVDGRVTAVVANLAVVKATVDAIVAGVPAIVNGLTAINAALTNTTTGLVGLNLARPQFGAFNPDGTIIAGTGQHPPAGGPATNAKQANIAALGGLSGMYVVDFANDVSSRFLTVTFLPTAPGATPAGSPAQAVSCASSDAAGGLCFAIENAGAAGLDKDNRKVAVKFGAGTAATIPSSGFTVAAISG